MNLRSADREVASKSDATIELETAKKWAARAIAAYRMFVRNGARGYFERYVNYKHEAIEHAATVEDHGRTAGRVQREIERRIREINYDGPRRRRRRR
jgi:hypothetical protein